MKLLLLILVAVQMQAQHLVTWDRRQQNTYHLVFDNQSTVELELVSQSSFRVRRGLAGPPRKPITDSKVEVKASSTPEGLRLETDDLTIGISKEGGLITVQLPASMKLYSENVAEISKGKALIEITVPQQERFYGLGPRGEASMDARGLVLRPVTPFFITGNGYAFWTDGHAPVEFDLGKTRPGRVRLSATGLERIEYFFSFGPSLKEIWDERQKIVGAISPPSPAELEWIPSAKVPRQAQSLAKPASSGTDLLCSEASALVHASLSGVLMPAFDVGRYRDADEAVLRRAARLGTFSPIVHDSSASPAPGTKAAILKEASTFRKRLNHFLVTYADEARYRGYPVIHPLLHQFPRDPEAGRHIDAFMFGDEFLVAPACNGAAQREVYLPMGNWTDWNTGQLHAGRRTVRLDVPADGVIVLAKSGSVIPLNGVKSGDPTELHYFPRNGGEFFLFEPDASDYTQAHASPAMDYYRVEIDSKVARTYEWVIHHMQRPKAVVQVDGATYEEMKTAGIVPPQKWRYDEAKRELHIGVGATAFSEIIVNINF